MADLNTSNEAPRLTPCRGDAKKLHGPIFREQFCASCFVENGRQVEAPGKVLSGIEMKEF